MNDDATKQRRARHGAQPSTDPRALTATGATAEAENGHDPNDTSGSKDELPRKFQRKFRFLKWSWRIKLAIMIFVVIGMVVYLYGVYLAASSLTLEDEAITAIEPTGNPEEYKAYVELTIRNPSSHSIEAEQIRYDAYIEGEFVGSGTKMTITIEPGTNIYEFMVIFNIHDLSPSVKSALEEQEVELTIKGEGSIPAKVFGLFTYTTIELPFSITESFSTAPDGPAPAAPTRVVLSDPTRTGLDSVRLTWTVNRDDDFARYEVHSATQRGFEPSNATRLATITNSIETVYEVEGLDPLTVTYFKIVVWDTENLSAASNEVSTLNVFPTSERQPIAADEVTSGVVHDHGAPNGERYHFQPTVVTAPDTSQTHHTSHTSHTSITMTDRTQQSTRG